MSLLDDPVPTFSLRTTAGREVSLADELEVHPARRLRRAVRGSVRVTVAAARAVATG
jgi:hypothetical protein